MILAAALGPVSERIDELLLLLKKGREQGKRLPPALEPFRDLPGVLTGATLTMRLSGDTLLHLLLDTKDAASAEKGGRHGQAGPRLGQGRVEKGALRTAGANENV